jgi:phosphate transport system substrate-binding protein
MRPAELAQAAKQHVNPSKVVIAVDAVAIIVNKDVPLRSVTIGQVGAIFRGDIRNWKELGGPDRPVTLYGRQSSSGTFGFLRSVALRSDYSDKMAGLQGNAEIVEAVKADRTGIGYVGVAFVRKAEGITVLSLALSEDQPFLSPLDQAVVSSGAYPLTRPLIQYVDGIPQGALKNFLDFELSPEGQKIIEGEGFFPIPVAWHK